MKKRYLEFYKECLLTGRLPKRGLCGCLGFEKMQDIFGHHLYGYWGFDGREIAGSECNLPQFAIGYDRLSKEFTPFRQTIVLLMAAMNGEL